MFVSTSFFYDFTMMMTARKYKLKIATVKLKLNV